MSTPNHPTVVAMYSTLEGHVPFAIMSDNRHYPYNTIPRRFLRKLSPIH